MADRMFDRFNRLRSRLVINFASDAVLDAYNDLNYGTQPVYEAGTTRFRAELFNWEADMFDRALPAPPGRILDGGAGGGREAFVLAERGYSVTAFEPSPALARSMAEQASARSARVEVLLGRYEQLPRLESLNREETVDLSIRGRFDGAILGWTSYSHVRSGRARVATLRAFAQVTDGPVLLSFYLEQGAPRVPGRAARVFDAIGLKGGRDQFTPVVGFFHVSRREEVEGEIAEAGLVLVDASWDDSDGRWPWVAVARRSPPAR
jgi:SAM-dependent methyltransferase